MSLSICNILLTRASCTNEQEINMGLSGMTYEVVLWHQWFQPEGELPNYYTAWWGTISNTDWDHFQPKVVKPVVTGGGTIVLCSPKDNDKPLADMFPGFVISLVFTLYGTYVFSFVYDTSTRVQVLVLWNSVTMIVVNKILFGFR